MFGPETKTSPATVANSMVVEKLETDVSLLRCLVVCDDHKRSEMFVQAFETSGWEATVCLDADEAEAEMKRSKFHLSLIDLDGADGTSQQQLRDLASRFAEDRDLLQMVCGNEGDPLEEIWALQLGAWLYLPGVDGSCDVAMLGREARQVVDRLHPECATSSCV